MFRELFDTVMDPYKNSLGKLPKTVRFQMMVMLSMMWSLIFCAMAGILVWVPEYILVHLILLLIGIFGTSFIFKKARKNRRI